MLARLGDPRSPRRTVERSTAVKEGVSLVAQRWDARVVGGEGPADGKDFDGVPGKLEKYFSDRPGEGD